MALSGCGHYAVLGNRHEQWTCHMQSGIHRGEIGKPRGMSSMWGNQRVGRETTGYVLNVGNQRVCRETKMYFLSEETKGMFSVKGTKGYA